MKQITIDAPCKINLSLDIVRRLENSYHEMDMVMQSVSLYDTLTLSLQEGSGQIRMTCSLENKNAFLACDDSNIVIRCTKAFLNANDLRLSGQDLIIHLIKRIPMMAGLGGGSADGAAVLSALNRLFETHLSCEQLEQIGVKIGADIPFCLRGGTLRARGIGELFSPLPAMPDCSIVIIKPDFGISTKNAFSRCDSAPYQHADVEKMIAALSSGNLLSIAGALENVFEVLCSEEESAALSKARSLLLENGAAGALLSGSGSALFGIFSDSSRAKLCCQTLLSEMEKGNAPLEGVFLCHPVSSGAF